MHLDGIKTVQVGDIVLAYKEIGSGDKYLISTQNFFLTDCHMELLGKPPYDYHCFLIYMRGYGQSTHITDPTPKDYTQIWANDVVAFAQTMNIPSFYYTGVSHGNWAGWHIAMEHPELLRGFVCCNGTVQFIDPDKMPLHPERPEIDWDEIVSNREALARMSWNEPWPTENSQRLARREFNRREHLEILMGRTKEEFTLPMVNDMSCCSAKTAEEMYEKLSRIPVPVLLWYGGLDAPAQNGMVLEVAKAIPGSSLLTYQHLGHGGADECPELAARDCDRFFRDTEGRIL